MSVETGSGTEASVALGAPLAGSQSYVGLASRRRFGSSRIVEARGPAACMRRNALFRRMLLVADVVAIVTAFLLTVGLSSRSVQLTWASIVGVPILLVGAKLLGLYDRDETLLRKTTLDEAPKLFQLATLCALVAWLAGGLIVDGTLDRHQAAFLWLALAGLLMLARTLARAVALRIAPAERCLFIGDEEVGRGDPRQAERSRRDQGEDGRPPRSRQGRAVVDGRLLGARLSEIRDLAQTLDVHRAIIAPMPAWTPARCSTSCAR